MSTAKIIFLAEDDADDLDFFRNFLKGREDIAKIISAENGLQLIDLLSKAKDDLPDAIILDQNMPKMNGQQTLKALKADKKFADIPVMIYSTYANETLLESCLENGAVYVCAKPATQEGYWKMMDDFFEKVQER